MKTLLSLLAVCAAVAPGATLADENRGWYVGTSIGISASDFSSSDASQTLGYTSATVDSRDFGGRVFGGFRFNPSLAAEFGVVDLGFTEISGNVGGLPAADELYAAGIYGALVGKLPIEAGVSLLGKLGLSLISGVYTCKQFCPSSNFSTSSTTLVPFVGVGLQVDLARRFAVRVEYEHFGKVEFDSGSTLSATYNLVTGGFLFKF